MPPTFASQGDLAEKRTSFTEIGPGLYAFTAEGDPNSGVIIGDDSVMVVEAQATPRLARKVIGHIRAVTPKPITHLVLTHYHAVRVLGASAYGAPTVIMSDAARAMVAERGQEDWDSEFARFPRLFEGHEEIPGLTWPTTTFSGRMTVYLGNRRVDILHPGRAHTAGDAVVWVPDAGAMFTGDIVEDRSACYCGDGHFADWPATLDRIATTAEVTAAAATDLVIEAATEREAVKDQIFASLQPHLLAHTLLTTNSSSLPITRMASRTDRPERFMGLHFMNPVPVMKLVELIRGLQTSDATYRTMLEVVERIGKTAASAADAPAFIVNRILVPMINEAVYALYEGVGNVRAIDTSMKLGANHPMGPLELADFIGLDTCLAIMNVLHSELGDTKYRPCPLLGKYVEAGWLGRKTGRGFYDYAGDTPVPTR
jgi:3-hydroxybutyryl-CoA dehydrogenase